MDPSRPGVFKCRVEIGETLAPESDAFVEVFQVAVDDDIENVFFPEMNLARSGETIVLSPGTPGSAGKYFLVKSMEPYRSVQIQLDLTAVDTRKRVTWVR